MNWSDSQDSERDYSADVAVIGMSCRFPGDATSPSAFLDMLKKGESAWSEVPKDRFDIDAYHHPSHEHRGTSVARGGYFLKEHPGDWDAPFFSTTAVEAAAMDPQQRVLLEVAFESFESAGVPISAVAGSEMACYVGAFSRDYEWVSSKDVNDKLLHAATGNGMSMLSNRISWFYDLKGPSATLDTACSSSLVTLHLACEAIRSTKNQTRTAIAAGCGLILGPENMTSLSALHFLSPDSRSYSFDERANGYARGEGIGALFLKHIDDAIRDGDTIRAVIRGTGVNQDGRTPGITLPSSEAQANLIRSTYASFGLELHRTTYFEAHGTGTAAGDPLEARAIGTTFGADPKRRGPIYIGSVKSNIGHLEGCAGIAGCIKSILSLETGYIFPQHDFTHPNPKIDMKTWQLVIPSTLTPWPTSDLRRISINSFGYGGTNAHVIIDDAFNYLRQRGVDGLHNTVPTTRRGSEDLCFQDSAIGTPNESESMELSGFFSKSSEQPPKIFAMMAPEQAAMGRMTSSLMAYLAGIKLRSRREADEALEALANTLCTKRSTFQWRSFVIASSMKELQTSMDLAKVVTKSTKDPNLLWVFTGQGAQWARMGAELHQHVAFAAAIDSADRLLKSIGAEWSVKSQLLEPADTSTINEPQYAQPLCTVVQIAIIELLRQWGVSPTAVVGHSSGEIAAAYAVGAISAHDAYKIAFHRGRLSQKAMSISNRSGAMLSVGLSCEHAEEYLCDLSTASIAVIACENSPSNVTISGDKDVLEILDGRLRANDVFARFLKVSNAYHSPHMEVVADEYLKNLEGLKTSQPREGMKMYSTVTGREIDAAELGPKYWVQNMVQPVQFVGALESIFSISTTKEKRRSKKNKDIHAVLEIGPHGALQGPIKQFLTTHNLVNRVSTSAVLSRGQDGATTAINSVARLWAQGHTVDLGSINNSGSKRTINRMLVDLPAYPWNHTRAYWHESFQSKNYRHPVCGRLDYAGMPVEAFNNQEPLFKNKLRTSEVPWLLDHVVQDHVIFPGAGMICAAIEVAQRLADKARKIVGFNLRDVSIGQALIIPQDDEGIETLLQLRPRKAGMRSTSSSWQEWTFYTISKDGTTIEHCSGLISVVYYSKPSDLDEGKEEAAQVVQQRQAYRRARTQCTKNVSTTSHYRNMQAGGITYGPMFRGLSEIFTAPSTACTTVKIPDTRSVMPAHVETSSVIHPAVLDALFQSCFPAFIADLDQDENTLPDGAMVPTLIQSMFVPANLPRLPGESMQAVTRTSLRGFRDLHADIMSTGESWSTPALTVSGFVATALGSNDKHELLGDADRTAKSRICSEVIVLPDIAHISQEDARSVLGKNLESVHSLRDFQHDSSKAAAIWAQRTLRVIRPRDTNGMAPHFKHYYKWLQSIVETAETRSHPHQHGVEDWLSLNEVDQDRFLTAFGAANKADGFFMNCIAIKLPTILLGQEQALSIMTEDNMLAASYSDAHGLISSRKVFEEWFDLAGHKNPSMQVLEIGAGTGSVTLPVLGRLGGKDGSPARFGKYVFTDISSGFFENAQSLLAPWGDMVEFRRLDVEKDVEGQGFALESYDVIVASNVIHATKNVTETLKNCLRLLKPGGRLILGEVTSRVDYVMMVYGVLPGWWLSEDGRTGGPLLTEQQWSLRLREAGFTGIDYVVGDTEDPLSRSMSVFVSTKPVAEPEAISNLTIVIQPDSKLQQQAASILRSLLLTSHIDVNLLSLESASDRSRGADIISLCELDSALLSDISQEVFVNVKAMVLKAKSLLWITSSATPNNPDQKVVSGMFRTAMCEDDSLQLHELHFSSCLQGELVRSMRLVLGVFLSTMQAGTTCRESEMIERNGIINVPRYTHSVHANDYLNTLKSKPVPFSQPLIQEGRALRLSVQSPGMLDSLCFVDDDVQNSALPADHVEVHVKANALNFVDVMIAMGKIPDDYIGIDAAGVVIRIGHAVTALKVGDRVALSKFGSFASTVRAHEDLPQILPPSMSFEEGCSIPTIFMTAYQCLFEIARLKKGEKVLIHAAAGGLGQALIQLAKHIDAEIYATVGTKAKRELLVGLGVRHDHIFSSRDLVFSQGIMRMTNEQGVDVVVNSLTGESLRKTWECLAEFGRFIEVGKVDIYNNTGLEMMPFLKNRMFAGVNLEHIARKRGHVSAELMGKVFKLIHKGVVTPVSPITVYDYSDMEVAFRQLQQGRHTGKIVLTISAKSRVPVLPCKRQHLKLKANVTYVLAGGLGGLGRSQALHMAQAGARYLIFLSRSGPSKNEARDLLRELESLGVKSEAFACDITKRSDLDRVMQIVKQNFPPVKGLIQGAMVLKDGLLESMSHEKWLAATLPKVQGTWNLHHALPKDMDFFVMLSSCTGVIGSRGQSNYAAGNTFQDAFASYRRSLGLQAQTLDIGIMRGIGYFEENLQADSTNYLNYLPAIHLNATDFLSIFDCTMTGFIESDKKMPAQLMMGLGSGGLERINKDELRGHEFYWLDKFAAFRFLRKLDTQSKPSHNSQRDGEFAESLKAQLSMTQTLEKASSLCQDALVNKLANAIMINVDDIDTSKPLHHYGVDSLVAVEIRNWIMREIKSDISVFDILANIPISQLALTIAGKSKILSFQQAVEDEND